MPKISSITLPDNNTYEFNAYGLTPSHTLTGEDGWYKILTLNVTNGTTRSLEMLISHSYSPTAGILRIYLNKISTGQTSSSRVNWLTTTIPIEYVRWKIETVNDTSTMSIYFYKSTSNSGIVDFFLLDYKNRPATIRDLHSGAWLSEAVSRPETANVATADILNNASTADSATTAGSATNALNDGNGDQIDATYLKTTDTTKAPADAGIYYGVCDSTTSPWTVTIPELSHLTEFPDGLTIRVRFNHKCTMYSTYLAINSITTPIYDYWGSGASSKVRTITWSEGEVVDFTFRNKSSSEKGWLIRRPNIQFISDIYDQLSKKTRLVRITNIPVSTGTNTTIVNYYISIDPNTHVSDSSIIVSLSFTNPSSISSGISWETDGDLVKLTGTCTSATTVDMVIAI